MKNRVHLILDDDVLDDPTVYTVVNGVVVIEDTDEDTTSVVEFPLPENDTNTSQVTATNTPLAGSTENQCSTSHAHGSNEDKQNCTRDKGQVVSLTNNNNDKNSNLPSAKTSKHDNTDSGVACPVCQQTFTGQSKSSVLIQHYMQVHLPIRVSCIKCAIFNIETKLPNHLKGRTHTIKCPFCPPGQKHWSYHALIGHIYNGHNEHFDGSSYVCPYRCNKILKGPENFIHHYMFRHDRVIFEHFTCDLCEGIGIQVQLREKNSLAHFVNEHGSVVTKDVYEAFAQSQHPGVVACFDKDQLPSTASGGSAQSALPSTSNDRTSKSSSSSEKMQVAPSNDTRNTRSSSSSETNHCFSSNDGNVLPSVSCSQSSSNSRDGPPLRSSDMLSISSNKSKTASSTKDKNALPSIPDTESSTHNRNSPPSCSNDKYRYNTFSTSTCEDKSSSSPLNDKNELPSFSGIGNTSRSFSSNRNNVPTSNNNDKSTTTSKNLFVLPSDCTDQRNTRSSCRHKTDSTSATNNNNNQRSATASLKDITELPPISDNWTNTESSLSNRMNISTSNNSSSSSTSTNDIIVLQPSSNDRRNTQSTGRDNTSCSTATNNKDNHISPSSSSRDKHGLLSNSNTYLSSNDKHNILLSNSNNTSKAPTDNELPSISNDRKNIEYSSHYLRSSSRSRKACLSNDTVHLGTDQHRSSHSRDQRIEVTIKNSLGNATANTSTCVSKATDSSNVASTSSTSKGVLKNNSHISTTTTWHPGRTSRHRSHSSDATNRTPQQGTNHSGHSTTTSQLKAAAKGKDLPDETNGSSNFIREVHTRKSLVSESGTRKSQSNDGVDKASGRLRSSDRSKIGGRSSNMVKERYSTSRTPNKGTHTHSSGASSRTISARSSTSRKRKRDSSPCSLEGENQNTRSVDKDKRNCHSTARDSHSCSSQYNSNDVHAHNHHKRPRTQSSPSTTLPQTSAAASSSRQVLSNLENSNYLPSDSLQNLSSFSHIIFIDLDNWGRFFGLPYPLPPTVFVWGFCGGSYMNKKVWSIHFRALVQQKRFFQHPKCGAFKNAADFALCVQVARLDLQLPVHIPFTILSGDRGFGELRNQLKSSARQIHLVDPHDEEQDMLYAMLASIGEK